MWVSKGEKKPVEFEHSGDRLRVPVPSQTKGSTLEAIVRYHGSPQAADDFDGFHWAKTADGRPWVSTSFQGLGSRNWWPCKDSYYHPEDKPERIEVRATVPKGLYAVSNGRLESRTAADEEEVFHWIHEYPLETYSVTLNVAPYEVVETELELPGIEGTVPFIYYVLPENAEKAALQFAQVPRLLGDLLRSLRALPLPALQVRAGRDQLLGHGAFDRGGLRLDLPGLVQASRERRGSVRRPQRILRLHPGARVGPRVVGQRRLGRGLGGLLDPRGSGHLRRGRLRRGGARPRASRQVPANGHVPGARRRAVCSAGRTSIRARPTTPSPTTRAPGSCTPCGTT